MSHMVEVGFKIKNSLLESEKILLDNGYEEYFKTQTHDIYYSKVSMEGLTERQMKENCIRLRHSGKFFYFENMHLLNEKYDRKVHITFKDLRDYLNELYDNGFDVVFDTYKTDWVYTKGSKGCQLQDIKDIGLLNYHFDQDITDLPSDEQFNILKNNLLEMGFELEYEYGIDKLSSLYYGKLVFSKDQNVDYKPNRK